MTQSRPTKRELSLELKAGQEAPSRARAAVTETFGAELSVVRRAALLTVLSELVANSVKYGSGGPIRVRIEVFPDRAVVGRVADGGEGEVAIRENASAAGGGMGLKLVDAFSDRWGVDQGTTDVWFELGVRPRAPAAA